MGVWGEGGFHCLVVFAYGLLLVVLVLLVRFLLLSVPLVRPFLRSPSPSVESSNS